MFNSPATTRNSTPTATSTASSTPTTTPTPTPDPTGTATSRRTARACESCRRRRIKCVPPYPCKNCKSNGYPHCSVRAKARPSRHAYKGASTVTTAIVAGTTPVHSLHHSQFITLIERELESLYWSKTGTPISLTLPEEDTLPPFPPSPQPQFQAQAQSTSTSTSTATATSQTLNHLSHPEPPLTQPQALEILGFFESGMLPFFSWMEARTIRALLGRYLTTSNSTTSTSMTTTTTTTPTPTPGLQPDELSLLFSCLSLGRLRQMMLTFDPLGRGEHHRPISGERRDDSVWYRLALAGVTGWGGASLTALNALSCLHLYALCTTTLSAATGIIRLMADQARRLGLLTKRGMTGYGAKDRPGILLFHVVFSSCFMSHLTGEPPVLKKGDFEDDLFALDHPFTSIPASPSRSLPSSSGSVSGSAAGTSGVADTPAIFSQLLLECELLTHIHDPKVDTLSIEFVLGFESKWSEWLKEQSRRRKAPPGVGDRFVDVHYHWDRIMLRVGSMDNPLLAMSSHSIIARSTMHILYTYRNLYSSTQNFNLAMPQLKRTVTCGHLVLLCWGRQELVRAEALEGLRMACHLLEQFALRWRIATEAMDKLLSVAQALGLQLEDTHDYSLPPLPPYVDQTNVQNQMTFPPIQLDTQAWETIELGRAKTFPQTQNLNQLDMNPAVNWDFDWTAYMAR